MRPPRPRRRPRAAVVVLLLGLAGAGCPSADDTQQAIAGIGDGDAPDELPVVRNAELPFHYPPELYAQKVQANVTLRLFIDSLGQVRPESTVVAESSGHPALDSAAVADARALRFVPARRDGAPVGVAVLFPIHFRHPELPPLPGDSVRQGSGIRDQGSGGP